MANDLRIVLTEQPDLVLTMGDDFIGSAYSPQIGVEDIEGGHRVTVTYRDAEQGILTKTFDVLDGETGAQGPKGDDGYSPTVTITDTAYGHRVTITDASGEHSYTVPTYVNEEQARADAEQARQSAESARDSAEQARTQAESQRAESERQRAAAESSRAAEWATLRQDISDAVEGAETVNATVSKSGTTATITVTDREGTTHIASVSDGAIGPAGQDGYSPTASVQRVEGGAEVTVTDASGTTTAMLYDATIEAGSVTDEMLAPDGIKSQVASMWGNRLTGELTGEVLTASDAYTAPPLAVGVGGNSTQDGTPTPDAPVEIVSVENPVLTFVGKNLFDKDNAILYNGYFDSLGSIRLNANFRSVCIPVVGGTTYTISSGWTRNADIWEYDVLPVVGETTGLVSHPLYVNTTISFTTNAESKYICINLGNITQVDYLAELATLQLELGSTATAYEPYQGNTATLPVTLRSTPDGTKDSLALTYLRPSTRVGWAWYSGEVTRRVSGPISILTFDNLADNSSGHHRARRTLGNGYLGNNGADITNRGMANRFTPYYNTYNNGGIGTFVYSPTSGQAFFILNDSESTLALANAWLAENPIEVYLALATPTTETIDPIELPSIIGPSCTIYATADATPTLAVTYERDVTIAYNALLAAIADIATS